MTRRKYKNTTDYDLSNGAGPNLTMTPFGRLFTEVLGGFALGIGLQAMILVAGTIGLAARHRGWDSDAMWRLLMLSVVPWPFIILQITRIGWAFFVAELEEWTGYDLNGSGMIGDVQTDKQIVFVNKPPKETVEGIPVSDLREFVYGVFERGHSWRAWKRHRFQSGRRMNQECWSQMCGILEGAGFIDGRKDGAAGTWLAHSPAEVLRRLNV